MIDKSGFLFSISTTLVTIAGSIFLAYIFDYLKVSNYIFRTKSIYQPYSLGHKK
jgi:hypothetical protein